MAKGGIYTILMLELYIHNKNMKNLLSAYCIQDTVQKPFPFIILMFPP